VHMFIHMFAFTRPVYAALDSLLRDLVMEAIMLLVEAQPFHHSTASVNSSLHGEISSIDHLH